MPKSSGGQVAVFVCLAIALVSACGSSSTVTGDGASGAAGSSGALGSAAGASAHAGTNSAGSMSSSGGTAGKGTVGAGGATDGGTQSEPGASGNSGVSGDIGGAQNVFIDQIVLSQGGGVPRCLPRALPVGPPGSANDGQVSCVIAELEPGPCDCSQTARAALPASLLTPMRRQLESTGICGGDSGPSCDTFCGCEIDETPGVASDPSSQLYACQNDLTVATGVDGFCVIDQKRTDANGAPAPLGNPALVAECPANEKRLLRFVGAGYPSPEATAFIGCIGVPVN